ncbi:hypothetical protein BP5796_12205 [Coleophoma crateriformis]|uniref:Phytanoyl-dioxygenase family protein n=1 Tax=Coleophoma crateriformis TaxID=565419 RepID=A0A3D8Q8W6_9HELO|nr:hypothetical protein BP5796_12205 [Coleophoma crateriformis]
MAPSATSCTLVENDPRPTPEVETLPGTASLDEILSSLCRVGGCIVKQFVSADIVAALAKDFTPLLEAEKGEWSGSFFSAQSRRVYGCCGKSRVFAEEVVGHRMWNAVCDALLSSSHTSFTQYDQVTFTSPPQVCNTTVYSLLPGSEEQALHRDDRIHHAHFPKAEQHYVGRDCGVGLFIAGKASTIENGATRFIPGSHLWDYSLPPPKDRKPAYAVLEPGDAFLMLSGCYHGASANTSKDSERVLYGTFFCKSTLRQEENQYLANDPKVIKDFPDRILRIMGYDISKPFLGWVDMSSPMTHIRREDAVSKVYDQNELI